MERGKHTPGPLEVYEGPEDKPELTVQHIGKGGQVVTVADFLQREIPPKERKANAVLFTAAPDMLEALENRVAVACRRTCDGDAGLHTGACDQARAAIAKAKRKA